MAIEDLEEWSLNDSILFDQMIETSNPNDNHPMNRWIDLTMDALRTLDMDITEFEEVIKDHLQDVINEPGKTFADLRRISTCESLIAAIDIIKNYESY